jgi:hypothetical protein
VDDQTDTTRHWKYISSYHGPWLQLPTEVLAIVANINFNAPAPRPIDPAIVFDVLKVRTLVDEATSAAVKAASYETSAFDNMIGHSGIPRLSKERKLRMREQAAQKLGQAYRTDEIACSVASMQGSSTLEDIGSAVLQRNPDSIEARYVNFFHEKIPSRHVAETTSVQPLLDILESGEMRHINGRPEVLRTCATVRVFLEDLEGAVRDLTEALAEAKHRSQLLHADLNGNSTGKEIEKRVVKQLPDTPVPEGERPSGLEGQLLFNRACIYLNMACKLIPSCISPTSTPAATPNGNGAVTEDVPSPSTNGDQEPTDADKLQAERRRQVKTYAKRAIRDFTAFLDSLHYSPDFPISAARDFNRCVEAATLRKKTPPYADLSNTPHTVYPLSQLFAAVPPSDLPEFPPPEDTTNKGTETCEFATFHPLLEEALHQLLMSHCLAQTSTKEIQRHASMAARLTRLNDAYPMFQLNHSSARVDWAEILRLCPSLLPDPSSTWDTLCEPPRWRSTAQRMAEVAMAGTRPNLKLAAQVRRLKYNDAQAERASAASALVSEEDDALTGWGDVMGRDLTPVTERAGLVGRWVGEVPTVTGVVRRRKKAKKGCSGEV